MKEIKKFFWLALNFAFSVLLIFLLLRCQKPIEPDIESKPTISIEVKDRATNSPIEGATIYLGPAGEDAPLSFMGTTNQNGILRFNLDIPCSGKYFKILVQPPPGTCYSTNTPYKEDSLLLYCCDAVKDIYFNCQYDLRCDPSLNLNSNLIIDFCLDTSNISENISKVFTNSSNKNLKVKVNFDIPNFLKVSVHGDFPNSPINLTGNNTTFDLDVLKSFFVKCRVEMNPLRTIDTTISLSFEGREDVDSLCFSLKLTVSIKANFCSNCDCPQADTLTLTANENLCFGEVATKTYSFKDLEKNKDVKNSSKNCMYIFGMIKDFKNSNLINISSIGGGAKNAFELPPSQSLSQKNLIINYKIPLTPKTDFVVDTAIYRMKIKNEFGKIQQCDVFLRIIDTLYINNLSIKIFADTLARICEEDTAKLKLCFENEGRCNFDTVITLLVSGPDKDKFYISTVKIPALKAGSKVCVGVNFIASPDYIWDLSKNCRISLGKTTFVCKLKLESLSSLFNNKEFTFYVNVDTTCYSASPCAMEFDSNRISRQETFVLWGKTINREVVKLKINLNEEKELPYAVYATEFYPPKNPTECKIYAFNKDIKFKLIRKNLTMPNEQTLCTYICRDVANQCNPLGWQDHLTLQEGDLIAINFDGVKCVFVGITKIFYDTVYDVHRICIAVCNEISFD